MGKDANFIALSGKGWSMHFIALFESDAMPFNTRLVGKVKMGESTWRRKGN